MKLVNIRSKFGPAEIGTAIHGEGPPVLLVAGLGGRGSFWNRQIPALSQHFRVITHDHRGCGVSSRSRMVYSAEQMAEDVIALMDALDIERAHVVGHSTGGAIGQFLALHHPQRLERLVISASWAGPTELFLETFRLRRQVLLTQGPQAYYFLGSLLASPADVLRPAFTSLDLRSHLHRIRTPSLVIGAEDDQLTPPGMQREVAELIPGARLQILPRGGHFYPVNSADAFNRLVLDFLGDTAAAVHSPEMRTGSTA